MKTLSRTRKEIKALVKELFETEQQDVRIALVDGELTTISDFGNGAKRVQEIEQILIDEGYMDKEGCFSPSMPRFLSEFVDQYM